MRIETYSSDHMFRGAYVPYGTVVLKCASEDSPGATRNSGPITTYTWEMPDDTPVVWRTQDYSPKVPKDYVDVFTAWAVRGAPSTRLVFRREAEGEILAFRRVFTSLTESVVRGLVEENTGLTLEDAILNGLVLHNPTQHQAK